MFKLLTACALLGVAAAQYAPAPVYKQEKLAPQPYAYEYGVADDYSKANFKKAETQDAYGNVAGSFTIALPDGRLQTTTYTADHENGFVLRLPTLVLPSILLNQLLGMAMLLLLTNQLLMLDNEDTKTDYLSIFICNTFSK
eukprot:TRINITY_DN166_c0_g1_i17.p1 TRINITY_DN166_c0_g1~~TRINITY_DN166_c0_g1_i17.p1  ORF type:complete len:141 (-),score=40.19 TRINITY_DN166_c0_g1_i17:172-594(-)